MESIDHHVKPLFLSIDFKLFIISFLNGNNSEFLTHYDFSWNFFPSFLHQTKVHSRTRYFVRFPFLTDEEFSKWLVTSDSSHGEGYSWAEFVRSSRTAAGCANALGLNESVYPDSATTSGNSNEAGEKITTSIISSFDDPNKDHEFGYTHPAS